VVIAHDFLTPQGPGPVIPFTITGAETVLVANGDQLFGTVTGSGVNNSGATSGKDVVTVTGGTGGFAGATGSYTERYTGHIFSQIGASVVGPLHTIFRGRITLGMGYCDPLQGSPDYCDPLQGPPAGRRDAGRTHHKRHQRRHLSRG
jgi:hypothetical protein